MVAFRSFVPALLAPFLLVSMTSAKGLFESDESRPSLASRQVATGNICATVNLVLLGINIASGVCVCLDNGVVTQSSVDRITTTIRANSGVLAPIINQVGGVTGATTQVIANIAPVVLARGTTCTYPANTEPNQCGGCGYTCSTGYVACGASCVTPGTTCISGIPSRKRDLLSDSLSARCPRGFEACLLPGMNASSLKSFSGYECIKTTEDLESCGGCVNPFPGQPTGVDCSGIPNVGAASCASGKCVIESCARGYRLAGGACVSEGKKLTGYWAALEEAAKVVGEV